MTLTVPPQDRAGPLEHVRIGGLGIQLIRRFASATRYAREDNRNRITMVIASDGARP